ncbi:MAG: anhydro-N-acetylmuramic acid kinase [Anaerolineae bacterium]|nr:anhydro-N-acetylmuramic acid kinase [Anaerolineae bacterium]
MLIVGLMSGTSADGIDAAVVKFSQERELVRIKILACIELPHLAQVRRQILNLFPPNRGSARAICETNVAIGDAFAIAALKAIETAGLTPSQVDLVASHGQTIYHQVEPGHLRSTLQIGEPAVIAEKTGITTISNFRPRDIAAGGQGAPLVSYIDYLLFHKPGHTRAIQNIGGIGNVTVLSDTVFAFDTGPGNALIDHAASRLSGEKLVCDLDGKWAARGTIHQGILSKLLAHPYLKQPPPKTTGRELFGATFANQVIDDALTIKLSPYDILATLTAFTADSIARAYADFIASSVNEVILSGGGQRNPTLVQMLKQKLGPQIPVRMADTFGIPSDGKESISFAVLGYLTIHGWTGTLATCTGANHASILGTITPGANYRHLLAQVLATTEQPPIQLGLEQDVPASRLT